MTRQSKKKKPAEKKTFVLDTNVILHDPDSIHSFENNDVVLPLIVLEELDKHKTRQDEVGANARHACRMLDELRTSGCLHDGVQLRQGGNLIVKKLEETAKLPFELSFSKNDHIIIALVAELNTKIENVILVSKDINIRVKCDALGLRSEDYKRARVANSVDEMYSGVVNITVSDELMAALHEGGPEELIAAAPYGKFQPNQIIVIKLESGQGKATIRKCVVHDKIQFLTPLKNIENVFGLEPKNAEQRFALDLLFDDNIKLVTLAGKAGCGKSLISIAAALDQLKSMGSKGTYDKFIVMRPIQPVGKDVGFLPGTLDEKMAPWLAPIEDNMNFLINSSKTKKKSQGAKSEQDPYLKLAQEKGLIEVEAITFMRGRSIPNAFILIDEAQNLSVHELKTLITRAGEGTKIVLTGDYQQIDNPHVDTFTNGFSYCIEKFKHHPIAGHVTLIKGERSVLASTAAEIL